MNRTTLSKIKTELARVPRWLLATGLAAAVLLVLLMTRSHKTAPGSTFTARRGTLRITVPIGGSTEALESQEIKCEVKGYQGVKILKIVEEGYQVTEEDVKTNKVLVELDSSELRKMLVQKEIDFQTADASLTEAKQSYDIQLNQNLSDVLAAEQKARFARMDFEKFLGDTATREIIDHLPAPAPAVAPLRDGGTQKLPSAREQEIPRTAPPDFSKYASVDLLGDGESKQKIRKFDDDWQVAQKEFSQARTALEGTKRLHEKGFVTKTELETDEFKFENARLKVQTAETARGLFLKYEFPKTAEEFLSKYVETTHELDRAKKTAISKLAQAEAKLRSAEGRYNLEVRQRKEFSDQIDKCSIHARKPGLLVYGGANNMMYYYGNQEQIREGALVREQQPIITIPDMRRMIVKVRIHESYIKKIQKGLKARITLDAWPDRVLDGEVSKVGLLPDSQNRYMNPDMNVYLTTIEITSPNEGLKPGMSAKVEIQVNELPDVVYVPIQAVTPIENKQVCYLMKGGQPERREVQIGQFNDEFIEIKSGIAAGDKICLRPPDALDKEENSSEPRPTKPASAPAKPAAQP